MFSEGYPFSFYGIIAEIFLLKNCLKGPKIAASRKWMRVSKVSMKIEADKEREIWSLDN